MAKQLNSTVHVHGHGVFGPGDKLPAEVRKLLADNPRVWDDGEDDEDEATRPGPSETAAAGQPVEEALKARIAELEAQVAAGKSDGDAGPSETSAPEYGVQKVAELREEIDRRNSERDPDGDGYIRPAGDKKADLVAALTADDGRE